MASKSFTVNRPSGRIASISSTSPTISDIFSKGSALGFSSDFVDNLDNKFQYGAASKRGDSGTESLGSVSYQTEYILHVQDGGASFEVGYAVEQMLGGYTMEATISFVENTNDHGFNIWDGYTNGYLIGIKDTGPTGGTLGPTVPGTSGDTGGYLGNSAGRLYAFDDPTAISCDVHRVQTIISPEAFREGCIRYEIDGLTQSDYSSIIYSNTGQTMDLTTTISKMEETYHTIAVNHTLFGATHANYISTVTIYDTNGISAGIDAVSGGTPDTSVSEFNTLYYNWLTVDDIFDSESEAIRDAYFADGTGLLDSTHKIRTLFETRNP